MKKYLALTLCLISSSAFACIEIWVERSKTGTGRNTTKAYVRNTCPYDILVGYRSEGTYWLTLSPGQSSEYAGLEQLMWTER